MNLENNKKKTLLSAHFYNDIQILLNFSKVEKY